MAQIRARRENGLLRFYKSDTNETVNVLAPFFMKDDFDCAVIGTTSAATSYKYWSTTGVNSGTAVQSSTDGWSNLLITTGDADNDDVDVASELVFNSGWACCCEAKIRVRDVSGTSVAFGFTDAQTEAADTLPVGYAVATLTTTATDCAMWLHDPDATTDTWITASANSDSDGTVNTSVSSTTDSVWHILRIDIDDDNEASFYMDGSLVATEAAVCSTGAALCVYVGAVNREATGNVVDVDYITAWQKRAT